MKHILGIFCLSVSLSISGCAMAHKVPAPTVAAVKSKIASASGASARSSVEIKKFRTKAEEIDYKATKALELL